MIPFFHFIFIQINSESPARMKNALLISKLIFVGYSNFRQPHQAFLMPFQSTTPLPKCGILSPKVHNRALLRFKAHSLVACRATNESITSVETESAYLDQLLASENSLCVCAQTLIHDLIYHASNLYSKRFSFTQWTHNFPQARESVWPQFVQEGKHFWASNFN